jgi:hypothetical protein
VFGAAEPNVEDVPLAPGKPLSAGDVPPLPPPPTETVYDVPEVTG